MLINPNTEAELQLLNLGSTEREILGYLWGRSETGATLLQLTRHVNDDNHQSRAKTTYQTVLMRMIEKRMVKRDRGIRRKEYKYFAAVTRNEYIEQVLDEINAI